MKKLFTLGVFVLLASFVFTSCDSTTKDAKRIAQIECDAAKLYKDFSANKDKIKALRREAEDLRDKYEQKAKSMTDNQKSDFRKKFRRAYEDAKDQCKDN
jgi:hypothetical protein